jgi:hypothetical protein
LDAGSDVVHALVDAAAVVATSAITYASKPVAGTGKRTASSVVLEDRR